MTRRDENVPVPDPSLLTTAQLLREIEHIRELYDMRFDQLDLRLQQRFEAQKEAIGEALTAADLKSGALSDKIDSLTTSRDSGSGLASGWGYLVGLVALIAAVVTIISTR